MCTSSDGMPGSVAEALRMASASMDYLNGADPDTAGDDDDASPADNEDNDGGHKAWGVTGGGARAASRARGRARERFTPDAARALRYAIARLAIDFVSGPAGLAGWLRTTLLAPPYSTPSLPLDIGYSDSIPASIRRAVLLRDRGCAWPRCGRPAAWCDVHHLQHKKTAGRLLSPTACCCAITLDATITEVGSGLNGNRVRLRKLLADPAVTVIVVEHRDRLARFGVEHLQAALSATGRSIIVLDPDEAKDDLVRDMVEVLTSMCARLYGRRSARKRADAAVRAAESIT